MTPKVAKYFLNLVFFVVATVGMLPEAIAAPGSIRTDGTLGAVNSFAGPNYVISSGFGRTVGTNLFHSFSTFSIGTRETATFSGPSSIANIISRVTGGASNIDGTIASAINGANLFLINPNGISFGPNAKLNISGSFYASTANHVLLGPAGRFDASAPSADVLTSAPPSAFGFLGPSAAAISVQGSFLFVPQRQTLALIGGSLDIGQSAALLALGGTIGLTSIASNGTIDVSTLGPTVGVGTSVLGSISVSGAGTQINVSESTGTGTGSGSVFIRGGQLIVDNALIFSQTAAGNGKLIDIGVDTLNLINGGQLIQRTTGAGDNGAIIVRAGDIAISGGNGSSTSGIFETAAFGSRGNSGNIQINADGLRLSNGGLIFSNTSGSGHGGGVSIAARAIEISGTPGFTTGIFSDVTSSGAGNGAGIQISTQDLAVSNGGIIRAATFGTGSAGNISIAATNIAITAGGTTAFTGVSSSANAGASAAGGSISINTQALSMSGGGDIQASTFGAGDGGTISIVAQNVSLNGTDSRYAVISSDVGSNAATGRGGNIVLSTQRLTLGNGGIVSASTFGPGNGGSLTIAADDIALSTNNGLNRSLILTDVQSSATGRGGSIRISTRKLDLQNGGQISAATFGAGNAGAIVVQASEIAAAGASGNDLSGILSGNNLAGSTGNGGGIEVTTKRLTLDSGGLVSTSTFGAGNAGSIVINADDISIAGAALTPAFGVSPSGVYANSNRSSIGNGGDIRISTQTLRMTNGSVVSAVTSGTGLGGGINITARESVTLSSSAQITSQSNRGAGAAGDIVLDAGSSLRLDNATIAARARDADGGNISIAAKDLIYLKGSGITTAVGSGAGNGGNIFIDPTFIVLDGSSIIANAFGGNGGNINIVADNIFRSPDSVISASSQLGVSGTVSISSPVTDIAGSLVALPTAYLDASRMLAERCAARLAGKSSSFVFAGRGGMPIEPDGPLPSYVSVAPEGLAEIASFGRLARSELLAQSNFGCSK